MEATNYLNPRPRYDVGHTICYRPLGGGTRYLSALAYYRTVRSTP